MESSAAIAIHRVETEFQNGEQEIHVLVPDDYRYSGASHQVLYVLPVEKSGRYRSGYPLDVLRDMDAHNRYGLLIVFMTMQEEPWFVDHAVDPNIRQAIYMHEFVVPFVDRHYRTTREPDSRFLLGFSKGGWGAYSLIFSRPDVYGFAAAWDAPFLTDHFVYEMEAVFGSAEQLLSCRPDLVARNLQCDFRDRTRLVLAGENYFGKHVPPAVGDSHVLEMHRVLQKEGVRHAYLEQLDCPHTFNSMWMEPVLSVLMGLASKTGQGEIGERSKLAARLGKSLLGRHKRKKTGKQQYK